MSRWLFVCEGLFICLFEVHVFVSDAMLFVSCVGLFVCVNVVAQGNSFSCYPSVCYDVCMCLCFFGCVCVFVCV